jgi:signal transduction histidine kinase
MRFGLTLVAYFFLTMLYAQEQPVIKLSTWQRLSVLDSKVTMYVDSAAASIESVALQKFTSVPHHYLDDDFIDKRSKFPHYFKVRVLNDLTDTAHYFFMASPQKGFEVFSMDTLLEANQLQPTFYKQRFVHAAKIFDFTLTPNKEKTFIIKLTFPVHVSPSIVLFMEPIENRVSFFVYAQGLYNNSENFSWIFCGMLLMMFLYIVLKFIQIQSREYFYYGAYIFFFLIFFLLRSIGGSGNEAIRYSEWASGLANAQLQAAAYVMYYFFVKHFLNTKSQMPKLHRILNFSIIGLLIYMAIDFTLFWIPELIILKMRIWDVVRASLLGVNLFCIIYLVKSKDPLGKYIVWGGLLLSVFGLVAMIFSFNPAPLEIFPHPFAWPLTYFQVGIAAELICFSLGLGYKSRLIEVEKMRAEQNLKIQSDRQEFERYRAMTDAREIERSRIAKDLHDGVGGMLSGVRISLANMQSKLTLKNDEQLVFARSLDMLDGSVQELRRVAHAMKPPSLEMFGLKVALRDFAESVNSMKTIRLIFQQVGEEQRLDQERELIVYRIVQELVNNVLKHAQAPNCLVQLAFSVGHVSLTVEDDGKGFQKNDEHSGMGLMNLKQRVDFMKGTFDLHTSASGTSIQINFPL